MYRYDEFDAAIVKERVTQFRGQVARRLSGALSEEEFKPLRLMNGLYLQLHAYMLRVAIPYGTLSSRQMRKSPANMTEATGISQRVRISSLTGPRLSTCPIFLTTLQALKCTQFRLREIASET